MHFFFPCRYPKKALDNYTFVTQSTRCSRRFVLKGKPSCCLKDLLDPSVGLRRRLEVLPSSDSLGDCLCSLVSHNTLEGNELTCWKAFINFAFLAGNPFFCQILPLLPVFHWFTFSFSANFFFVSSSFFKSLLRPTRITFDWIGLIHIEWFHVTAAILSSIERTEFLFLPTGAFLRSGKVSLSTFREISLKNPFEQIAQL